MAIEKKEFFQIIKNVSESKDLNENNLLEKIKNELKEKDIVEYNKFDKNFSKEYQFGIKISEEAAEDWTLLHLAVACNNLSIVELLLKKKVNVNTRVKDGSKDDGPTALHIAAFYGHKDMVEHLLKDDRVNPSLKSKNKTPKDMVGDVSNKNTLVEMLVTAEKSYLTNSKQKVRDLKPQDESIHHLSQVNHKIQASTAVNGNNAPTTLGNGKRKSEIKVQEWDEKKKENNCNIQSKQTSSDLITDESSCSTVNEQYRRVSVKDMVEKIESSQKINTTYSSKQAPAIESDGDDSGLELGPETAPSSSHFKISHDGTSHVEKNVDNQTLESTPRSQIQLKDSQIKKLEDEELKRVKQKLEKAQKDREELKNCVAGHETRQEAFNRLDEENKLLKQKMQNLESENATLKGKLEENKDQHSKYVAENETRQEALNKLDEENKLLKQKMQDLESENTTLKDKLEENKDQHSKNVAEHKAELEALNKQNQEKSKLLKQEIKNLESENAKLNSELEKNKNQHSQTSEVSLKKVEKKPPLSKVAYVSLVTTSMVGSILSIVSGLFVLSMVATSVTSALIAGGITYTMSKPTTELKEVNIQSPDNSKACGKSSFIF